MLPEESRTAFYFAEGILFLATLLVALIVLGLTLATFDRCMGRVPERARRVRREPGRRVLSPRSSRTGRRSASTGFGGDECMTGGERRRRKNAN